MQCASNEDCVYNRSIVISRLDYCNGLLHGMSQQNFYRLQSVQHCLTLARTYLRRLCQAPWSASCSELDDRCTCMVAYLTTLSRVNLQARRHDPHNSLHMCARILGRPSSTAPTGAYAAVIFGYVVDSAADEHAIRKPSFQCFRTRHLEQASIKRQDCGLAQHLRI